MKPMWIPVLVGLLCAYSVCFASGPLTYFEVKVAVKISPKYLDPDLNLFVTGQDIRLLNLGLFLGLNGREGFIARRAMASDPREIAPSWPIQAPKLLVDWMNESEPHNIYIRLTSSATDIEQTIKLLFETSGTLILGESIDATFDVEAHQDYMRRKYILDINTHNAYVKTKRGIYRVRELIHPCNQRLIRP